MKYILKLNEAKVQEARAKMHESYKGLLAITLTNEGTKEKPAFRVHCLENGYKKAVIMIPKVQIKLFHGFNLAFKNTIE